MDDDPTFWLFWGFTLVIIFLLGVFILTKSDECEKRGGVDVHGTCIKKECIIK